jgi:NAD(P)-dependent dehydrogenase (short-subunit alcohol dehydrogenase family)
MREFKTSKVPFDDGGTLTLALGANRGIGFQLSTRFVQLGYAVYGTFRPQTKDDKSVEDVPAFSANSSHGLFRLTIAQLRARGVKTLELDFTDENTISRAAEGFGDQALDVLVNCGGEQTDASSQVNWHVVTESPIRSVLSLGR